MVLCRFTRGTQGFNAWSFADKPCVARRHSRMRAVAVSLLSLRHVHLVHQVHQVHPAKCFVTKTCASASVSCTKLEFEKSKKTGNFIGFGVYYQVLGKKCEFFTIPVKTGIAKNSGREKCLIQKKGRRSNIMAGKNKVTAIDA